MSMSNRPPLSQVVRGLTRVPDLADYRNVKVDNETVLLLRYAETRVRRLRKQVEARLAEAEPRMCARCRRPVTGRPDRKYCSDRCRQSAYQVRRARQGDQ
jgi:hypothetical protein